MVETTREFSLFSILAAIMDAFALSGLRFAIEDIESASRSLPRSAHGFGFDEAADGTSLIVHKIYRQNR
jgi:hypothetical protein